MHTTRTNCRQSGFSMVEVMVTLVILLTGLLGLAGLMVQSQRSEMESYQRVQALVLLQDMESRINANRKAAVCYQKTNAATGTPYLGTGSTIVPVGATACTVASIQTIFPSMPSATATLAASAAAADMNAWNNALLGAAETTGVGSVGAMIGARGCISYDSTTELTNPLTAAPRPGSGIYTLSVAWQGLGDTVASANLCGTGQYGAETRRRVVSLTMRIGNLR